MTGNENAGDTKRFGGRARETLDPTDVGHSLKEHYEEAVQAPLTARMQTLLEWLDHEDKVLGTARASSEPS